MKTRAKVLSIVAAVVVVVPAGLALAPSRVEPRAWTPLPVPAAVGPLASNERLAGAEWLARDLPQPESLAVDRSGRLVAGLADGRIVRVGTDGSGVVEWANTGGRPMGMKFGPDGRLYVCDAHRGLVALDESGHLETLAAGAGGVPFGLADDLAINARGVVYFTDASTRFSIERYVDDVLEHQTTGRLLEWDPTTHKVTRLADGFSFANGVALGPSEDWVVMAETGANRLWRIWVSGARRGQREPFGEPLPGFPDNITWSPARHRFWVAIFGPRDPLVDGMAPHPTLRKMVSHLPLPPRPTIGYVLGVDETGRVEESLQSHGAGGFYPITSALEHDGYLYLGSVVHAGFARVRY